MPKVTALVSGFARTFALGYPIENGIVYVLENPNLRFETNAKGIFGPFEWPVGEQLTLVFEKDPDSFWFGYRTIQSATFIVPEGGINDTNYLKNISFQVPSNIICKLFTFAMGGVEDPAACQITTTITPPDTTMDDIPQGVEGVTANLFPYVNVRTFYFDIFPICDKTNPFSDNLEATSMDGGVALINVPPGEYKLQAQKNGMIFSEVLIKARAGILVNVSPPFGPTLLKDLGFFKPALVTNLTNTNYDTCLEI